MIFLKDYSIAYLYTKSRDEIEKICANHGENVESKASNTNGVYLTNDFKIIFDDKHLQQKEIVEEDDFQKIKEKHNKDIKYIYKRLNKQYMYKTTLTKELAKNVRDIKKYSIRRGRKIYIDMTQKQKDLIIEIYNNKRYLLPFLKIFSFKELKEFDATYVPAFVIFPDERHRRFLRQKCYSVKISQKYFILRKQQKELYKKIKEKFGEQNLEFKEVKTLCEKGF